MTSLQELQKIDPEQYRLEAMGGRDWGLEDVRWLKTWLCSLQGMAFMKILFLQEQAKMMGPCRADLTTEEGIKQAIKMQGEASGWSFAIGQIFDLADIELLEPEPQGKDLGNAFAGTDHVP